MRSRSEAFYREFEGPAGPTQRYCIWHQPFTPPAALVIYVHPFAEEMNKSRRMAALQSHAFAAHGCAVLQMDLLGCGDSAGDFGDATWDAWIDDVRMAFELAREIHARTWVGAACPPVWLWGLRAGSLLASAAAVTWDRPVNFLFWQPTPSGKAVLQQFLRLKGASALGQPSARETTEQLRSELAAQRPVEVAGYVLAPRLASGLADATLQPPAFACKALWIEVSLRNEPALTAGSQAALTRWQAAGVISREQVVAGPAFWSTVEMEDAPALVSATTSLLMAALKS